MLYFCMSQNYVYFPQVCWTKHRHCMAVMWTWPRNPRVGQNTSFAFGGFYQSLHDGQRHFWQTILGFWSWLYLDGWEHHVQFSAGTNPFLECGTMDNASFCGIYTSTNSFNWQARTLEQFGIHSCSKQQWYFVTFNREGIGNANAFLKWFWTVRHWRLTLQQAGEAVSTLAKFVLQPFWFNFQLQQRLSLLPSTEEGLHAWSASDSSRLQLCETENLFEFSQIMLVLQIRKGTCCRNFTTCFGTCSFLLRSAAPPTHILS